MIQQFEVLTEEEVILLLKAPALVAVLVASGGNDMTKEERAEAINLAHLKTLSPHPDLEAYNKNVDAHFEDNFQAVTQKYTPFDAVRIASLKKEINTVNHVIDKLDEPFATLLRESLANYAEHVKKANRSIFEDFLLPFSLQGITD